MRRTPAGGATAPPFYPGLCDHLARQIEALGSIFRHPPTAVLDYFRPRLCWHNGRMCVLGTLTPTEGVLLRVNGPDMLKLLAEEAE